MIIYGKNFKLIISKRIPKNLSVTGNSIKSIDVNDYQMLNFSCSNASSIFICRFYKLFVEDDASRCWRILNTKSIICSINPLSFYNLHDYLNKILKLPIKYDVVMRKWILDESLITIENDWRSY